MNNEFLALCLKAIATGESQEATFDRRAEATYTRNQFYKFRKPLPKEHKLWQISLPNAKGPSLIINLINRPGSLNVEDEYTKAAEALIEEALNEQESVNSSLDLSKLLDSLEESS